MGNNLVSKKLVKSLAKLSNRDLALMDLLAEGSFAEKIIDIVLNGAPNYPSAKIGGVFRDFFQDINSIETTGVKVVIFGGGSGLSNILGGDSRRPQWKNNPFTGLKEIFPKITSIVCVTDDGGATGQLLKDLPLIALGDLRHVLLSSIRKDNLKRKYNLDDRGAEIVTGQLFDIFNYRFNEKPATPEQLLADTGATFNHFPDKLIVSIRELISLLFSDFRLKNTINRNQCLGNLLIAASIYKLLDPSISEPELIKDYDVVRTATIKGLEEISILLGGDSHGVLPCTITMAQLQILYGNGVLVTSENKSAYARRGYPVDRVFVEYFHKPLLPVEITALVKEADIIIFAPGSLYTSVIPILQVPGLAEVIRQNRKALKLLIANIWVQKGETDASVDAPERKFYVSDLIRAYHRNIPGGVNDLFRNILTLGLSDIPGSILQSYALEDKEPIYLDRERVRELGFEPIEACIFSKEMLEQRRGVQHDPKSLALAIRTLWGLKESNFLEEAIYTGEGLPQASDFSTPVHNDFLLPCKRYENIREFLSQIDIKQSCNKSGKASDLPVEERRLLISAIEKIIWGHPDILLDHLSLVRGIIFVKPENWKRCQQWDNVFSFYEPENMRILIRRDQVENHDRFQVAFLVALGQSLLGNYALEKTMEDIRVEKDKVGRLFRLTLREPRQCNSFFSHEEIDVYLGLSRMMRSKNKPLVYTRLINSDEGFTPPGMLFGLFYAWYLDNRFATHIEYKMSIMRNKVSNLIPEQVKVLHRREGLVRFFREKVFRASRLTKV